MDNTALDLQRKLGLKPDIKAYSLHAPAEYIKLLPPSLPLKGTKELGKSVLWLQAFYNNKAELEKDMSQLKRSLAKNGQLWVSWPKKSSGVTTDLSDDVVRNIGLAAGLVDVKVAAINDTWSGIKFVFRLSDR